VLANLGTRTAAFRAAYLTLIATSMVGWFWLLFVSLEWVLGV
jgi:hypothetical protein